MRAHGRHRGADDACTAHRQQVFVDRAGKQSERVKRGAHCGRDDEYDYEGLCCEQRTARGVDL